MISEAFLIILFPLITYSSNNQGFELALNFLKSLNSIIRPNFVCNVSPREAKAIYTNLGDVPVGFGPPVLEQNVIFCADDFEPWYFQDLIESSAKNAVGFDWLVVGHNENLRSTYTWLPINKRVYNLNLDAGVIGEEYHIVTSNTHRNVHNVLVNIAQVNEVTKFHWLMDKCTLCRRSDLKGTIMSASVGNLEPNLLIRKEHFDSAVWFEDDKGSVLSMVPKTFIGGPYASVMFIMESDLNMTLSPILRQDNLVGLPLRKDRNKVTWNGRIGDLLAGDNDIMVAPVSYTIERANILDFLTLGTSVTSALHVSKNAGNEEEAWLTYILPFRPNSWMALMANTLAIVLFLLTLQLMGMRALKFRQILQGCIGDLWMVFFSYFGRPSNSDFWWSFILTKMVLLVIFLSGIISNMSYRASLTSELSVRKHILPFTTAEGFYHSEFQLIYAFKSLNGTLFFLRRQNDLSWLSKRLMKQKHEDSYFPSVIKAIDELTKPHSRKALFLTTERMATLSQYRCHVTVAWKVQIPATYTMSLIKGSPFTEIVNYVLLKRMETGSMRSIWNQHQLSKNKGICANELTVESISLQKVFGAEVVLAIGICVSLLIFMWELASFLINKTKTRKENNKCQCLLKTYEEGLIMLTARWGPPSLKDQSVFRNELTYILLKHLPPEPVLYIWSRN